MWCMYCTAVGLSTWTGRSDFEEGAAEAQAQSGGAQDIRLRPGERVCTLVVLLYDEQSFRLQHTCNSWPLAIFRANF